MLLGVNQVRPDGGGAQPQGLLKIPRARPRGPVWEPRGERLVQLCSISSCERWVFYSFSPKFYIIPFLTFCRAGCWEMTFIQGLGSYFPWLPVRLNIYLKFCENGPFLFFHLWKAFSCFCLKLYRFIYCATFRLVENMYIFLKSLWQTLSGLWDSALVLGCKMPFLPTLLILSISWR